ERDLPRQAITVAFPDRIEAISIALALDLGRIPPARRHRPFPPWASSPCARQPLRLASGGVWATKQVRRWESRRARTPRSAARRRQPRTTPEELPSTTLITEPPSKRMTTSEARPISRDSGFYDCRSAALLSARVQQFTAHTPADPAHRAAESR